MRISFEVPDGLYAELQEASAATLELGYGPEHWACDVVVSELAARRLPKVSVAPQGARIGARGEADSVGYKVVRPERSVYA